MQNVYLIRKQTPILRLSNYWYLLQCGKLEHFLLGCFLGTQIYAVMIRHGLVIGNGA